MKARAFRRRDRLRVVVTADRPSRATAGLAAFLMATAPRRAAGTVSIALVSDARIRALNRAFRGVDKATDVLSFPDGGLAFDGGRHGAKPQVMKHLGDIAIAAGVARKQAAGHRHTLTTELRVLALHGLLHLLGYDHERDRGEMRRLEERLRRRAGLTAGLISRTGA
jgi:probable rRNA maturation factor